jgi:FdhD protein
MRRPTARVHVTAVVAGDESVAGAARRRPDQIVTEEPMEIRVHGPGEAPRPLVVTMRTPGNDFELAVGFCTAEGLIETATDLDSVEYCVGTNRTQEFNVVTVRLRQPIGDALRARAFAATAACGVCGTATLDDLAVRCGVVRRDVQVAWSALREVPARLGASQSVFATTGGLHAAGLFDAQGTLDLVREDVGRHNALDKLIGRCVLDGQLPVAASGVVVSGRVGFELVQKAAVAGIAIVAAIGAPSSLAIETARRFGVTIIGFLRADRANIYTLPQRVDLDH